MLALAVMSTAFTSLAIATGFERRYGVIKRLGSSPLPRSGPARSARSARCCSSRLLQIVVISRGRAGPRLAPASPRVPRGAARRSSLGTAAFASLGLFVAGVLRAEATLAAANLVYLLLLAGGAVVLPASAYGGFGRVARLLPSGRPRQRAAARLLVGQLSPWSSLLVLLVWAVVGAVLTARTFTWE